MPATAAPTTTKTTRQPMASFFISGSLREWRCYTPSGPVLPNNKTARQLPTGHQRPSTPANHGRNIDAVSRGAVSAGVGGVPHRWIVARTHLAAEDGHARPMLQER